MDRDLVREALLAHNYFPNQKEKSHELPPCFSTVALTAAIATKIVSAGPPFGKSKGHDYVPYALTRFNGGPRICGVPHPYAYCRLVNQIHKSWANIEPRLASEGSAIQAKLHADGRLFKMDYGSHTARSVRYIHKSSCARFVARADISNFFPSIYTHAIPWAVVGIDKAKQATSWNTWYDKLDQYTRDCRRAETNGISIGPGTSSLIAEIILSKIDRDLQRRFVFDRYIDDYTAFCQTRQEAEDFIRRLEFDLSKYSLYLNFNKTGISQLPHPEVPDWIDELRVEGLSKAPSLYEVKTFISRAISLSDKHPDGSVLRYAINSLSNRTFKLSVGNYTFARLIGICQNRLHLCSSLGMLINLGKDAAGNFLFANELVALIDAAVSARRSDAMCWSLWLARETKTAVPQKLQDRCRKVYDPFGTVLLYMVGTPVTRGAVTKWVRSRILNRSADVKERNWILIHYLFSEKRLKQPEVTDASLRVLRKEGARFYS